MSSDDEEENGHKYGLKIFLPINNSGADWPTLLKFGTRVQCKFKDLKFTSGCQTQDGRWGQDWNFNFYSLISSPTKSVQMLGSKLN